MGAQRDADGFAAAHSDGNPEVIDVARDPVGFRGESDWDARHVHKLSMAQLKVPVLAALAVSVWQSRNIRSIGRTESAYLFLRLARRRSRHGFSPVEKTKQTEHDNAECGEMIAGKNARHPRCRADKFVGETEEAIAIR